MRSKWSIAIAAILLSGPSSGAQNPAGKPGSGADLVGTWRVETVNGESRPPDNPVHKHLTTTHFVVVGWNPKDNNIVTRVHGGPYTAEGGKYTEVIAYGVGGPYEALRTGGGRFEYSCRIDRNQWHIDGKNQEGNAYSETWVRVDSANAGAKR